MGSSIAFVFLFLTLAMSALGTENYTGTYLSAPEYGPVTVVLKQDAAGQVQGTMASEGVELLVRGAIDPPAIEGTVLGFGKNMKFRGQLEGDQLFLKLLELDQHGQPVYGPAETLILQRQGAAASGVPASPTDTPQVASSRAIVINGTRLSPKQISSLEQLYNIQIQDGTYWYDKVCRALGGAGSTYRRVHSAQS